MAILVKSFTWGTYWSSSEFYMAGNPQKQAYAWTKIFFKPTSFYSIMDQKPGVNELLEKLGDKSSLFVLGLLQEGYSEETIDNKSNKMRMELNVHLKAITRKLKLASPLRINKARECFASTLNRANKSVVKIAETMGHSTVAVTINYYIGGMNNDELLDLHDSLF